LLSLVMMSAQPAFSWGDEGHQIVARIAARNLTAKARQGIVDLFRRAPMDDLKLLNIVGKTGEPADSAVEDALAKIAIWPDHMPGGKGVTQPWHFIDIGLFEGPTHMSEHCDAGCVNALIGEIAKNLPTKPLTSKFAPTTTFDADKELRFLVHFVGDIHQPLHSSTDADAGGNCVHVTGIDGSDQLHAVWDTGLVGEITDQASDDVVDEIIKEFRTHTNEFQMKTDPDQIATESFGIAKQNVYAKATPKIPTIHKFVDVSPRECKNEAPRSIQRVRVDGEASYDNDATLQIVRQQLFKAGVRLAAILNRLFA
jgi:hypothetical protein